MGGGRVGRNEEKNGLRGLTRVESINTKGTFLVFKPKSEINHTKK